MKIGRRILPLTHVMNVVEDRARYTDLVINSTAKKKLIVAGPGTGKTTTFHRALEAAGGRGLALTFINNLARDLEIELADVADSNTLHGYCKSLLHRNSVDGLTADFHYYPPLLTLLAQDMYFRGRAEVSDEDVAKCLRTLDNSQGMISDAMEIGAYYNSVSHDDAVYRMFRYLENNSNSIPHFPLVVVDEYQDFNLLETKFIDLLAERSPVLIAGDDDQALYGFKQASPDHIRALARHNRYEKFELPYCSRCTEVIVESVHDVLRQAANQKLLTGRLSKSFQYYPPDKSNDSKCHPRIIHAQCTVERNDACYMGKYVAARVAEIPENDVRESREKNYPTALVIGPVEFVRRVHAILAKQFPDVVLKHSFPPDVSVLDGYRQLCRDEMSRLGWRIILHCDGSVRAPEIVAAALSGEKELADLIPYEYRERHLQLARLVGRVGRGEALITKEQMILSKAIGEPFDMIESALCQGSEGEAQLNEEKAIAQQTGPSVICTSLLGAKGLSASRVFIVGFNNGHFPRNPVAITDDEIRSLLVALSRTRKRCYLVSCRRFGEIKLQSSVFLNWFHDRITSEWVDKAWMNQHFGRGGRAKQATDVK